MDQIFTVTRLREDNAGRHRRMDLALQHPCPSIIISHPSGVAAVEDVRICFACSGSLSRMMYNISRRLCPDVMPAISLPRAHARVLLVGSDNKTIIFLTGYIIAHVRGEIGETISPLL
jgi:hypothetical protein